LLPVLELTPTQILFDGKQEIVGARIRTYLLERARIVFQATTERNYHIFYQLCAGAPSKEKKDLGLDSDVMKFTYLKQGGPSSTPIAGVDDAEEFRATQQALSTVGISVEKQWAVFRLLAAILHLGNIKISQARADANIDDNDPALLLATRFLGVNLAEFKKWTVKKQITTRSEKIITSLNSQQATVVKDSVAKFVYACMFEWLVAIVNESLAGENGDAAERAEMFIGVLDIYGFEHFQKVRPFNAARSPDLTVISRTLLNNSASIMPTRSCNKRYTLSHLPYSTTTHLRI
jgi:myosin-5